MSYNDLSFIKRNSLELLTLIFIVVVNYLNANINWYSLMPLIIVSLILIFDIIYSLKFKNDFSKIISHQAKLLKHSWFWYFLPIAISLVLAPKYKFDYISSFIVGCIFIALYLMNYRLSQKLINE